VRSGVPPSELDSNDEIYRLKQELKGHQEVSNKLKEEKQDLEETMKNLEEDIHAVSTEKDEDIEALQREIQQIEELLEITENEQRSNLLKENKKLQTEVNALKGKIEEIRKNWQGEYRYFDMLKLEASKANKKLEDEFTALEKARIKIEREHKTLEEERKRVKQEIAQLTAKPTKNKHDKLSNIETREYGLFVESSMNQTAYKVLHLVNDKEGHPEDYLKNKFFKDYKVSSANEIIPAFKGLKDAMILLKVTSIQKQHEINSNTKISFHNKEISNLKEEISNSEYAIRNLTVDRSILANFSPPRESPRKSPFITVSKKLKNLAAKSSLVCASTPKFDKSQSSIFSESSIPTLHSNLPSKLLKMKSASTADSIKRSIIL
jgi:chromosome segregation ATPase